MPRPTTAQVVCGSLTVVLSTCLMLLVSGARSGPWVVAAAAAGLMLGLVVALAVAARGGRRGAGASAPATTARAAALPRPRVPEPRGTRVTEHSLRR